MPGFLTDLVHNQVLDCLFGGVALKPPINLYVGLSKLRASKGQYVVEPDSPSYFRAKVGNDLANFPASTLGEKFNACTIEFPQPRSDWGTIKSVFIADAPSGGSVLAIADLATPQDFDGGSQPPRVPVGSLFLSIF